MGLERRGCVVQPWSSANWKREEPVDEAKPFKIPKRDVWEAFKRVKANQGAAGVDGQSIAEFEANLSGNLYKLWNRLSSGSYFPPPVRRVEIPKANGGTRPLGIPTVADRIAQEVARRYLEPILEPVFHIDSYGYRPGKSAIEAVHQARQRCWRYDWVLDLDIKGFFDSIDWELLLKALRHHTDCPWVLLYIERWLKAPVQMEDGSVVPRMSGTPQGGVISPTLANLFLHYAFDMWMARTCPHIPFERYADDVICHCKSAEEARALWRAIADRFAGLQAGAASAEDKARLLQGREPARRFPRHPLRFSRLPVSSPEDHVGEAGAPHFRAQFPARGQPEGVDAHRPRYSRLGAASPQRQVPDRAGPDVQSVHPWLDHLLQPLLQDAVASDPQADRCLCHPVGTSQVQANAPSDQRRERLV
jgi:RNA-directed DNA polymerase